MSKAKSFRLSQRACELLVELAKRYGISQTAMLEVIIRDKAAKTKKEAN